MSDALVRPRGPRAISRKKLPDLVLRSRSGPRKVRSYHAIAARPRPVYAFKVVAHRQPAARVSAVRDLLDFVDVFEPGMRASVAKQASQVATIGKLARRHRRKVLAIGARARSCSRKVSAMAQQPLEQPRKLFPDPGKPPEGLRKLFPDPGEPPESLRKLFPGPGEPPEGLRVAAQAA